MVDAPIGSLTKSHTKVCSENSICVSQKISIQQQQIVRKGRELNHHSIRLLNFV